MQGNILGQSSNGSLLAKELNIYAQLQEPEQKEGLWIKTEQCSPISMLYTKLKNLPRSFISAVAIGNDIYLLGNKTNNDENMYKYNISTGIFTKLTMTPYNITNANQAVAIDTNIYLLGCGEYSTEICKYDTLTDSYTTGMKSTGNFNNSSVVAIGNDIYLISGTSMRKYNTLTDTYTNLKNVPFSAKSAVVVNNDIYVIGPGSSNSFAPICKYNVESNTYISYDGIPCYFQGAAVAIGTDIYLLGCDNSEGNYRLVYKYSTLTNTYTKLQDIPYDFFGGLAVMIENNIYLIGSNSIYKYRPNFKLSDIVKYKYDKVVIRNIDSNINFENKSICILTKDIVSQIENQNDVISLTTKFLNLRFFKEYLSSIFIYDNDAELRYSAYYGTGFEWKLLENV